MKEYLFDQGVLACPHPKLDEAFPSAKKRFQFLAYQKALKLLLDPAGTAVIHAIPAGAGSGKTRLLVAILNGLLRCGIPAHLIEAISFTNASANDFRRKHIQSATDPANVIPGLAPQNICFSTVHQCALNVLRKLQPHLGGVGYYFEDARTGGQDDDDEERRKAVRLALYATVVYGNESFLAALARHAAGKGKEKTFILDDLDKPGVHLEKAKRLIREELVSDAGLGAFTNMAEGGPDYCIAVATDALMRLSHAGKSLEDKRKVYGIPAFMAVDEAQDLDFLQLLFLRALAQNGTSIILVGDPRQTLYEFRNSLSNYPFEDEFMRDFLKETGIRSSISEHALQTNYRCRKEIVEAAEQLSSKIVDYSAERHRREPPPKNLEIIRDPQAIKEGIADERPDNRPEKCAHAVSVIVGEPARVGNESPPKAPLPMDGALGLLPEFQRDAKATDPEVAKSSKRSRPSQIVGLGGGPNQALIREHFAKLYERAAQGETVAIITRNGVKQSDLHFLKNEFEEFARRHGDAADRLKLNLINPPKHSPLAEYWFPDSKGDVTRQLPFSSLMFAGALSFVLSSDAETQKRLKVSGKRPLTTVFVRPNGIRETELREDYIQTIAEELKVFFGGVTEKLGELLPDHDKRILPSHLDKLRLIVARFTFDVLVQYGKLLWKTRQVSVQCPCRFHQMACEYLKGREDAMAVRPLTETKRYLKLMWVALSSTPFGLTEIERSRLEAAGLAPEFMDAGTSLNNFPQHINDYCCIQASVSPDLDKLRETFINDRETIYDEFSQLWHTKTRTYMREIARSLGKEVRANPQSSEESFRLVVWSKDYQAARYKARFNITHKSEKKEYGGLFTDLVSGLKHDAVVQRRTGRVRRADDGKKVVINLTTIHSAKGLEWDHVMLFFPQPSPNDKDSSFKACRDLVYVAVTRAARTLTIVLQQKKKELVESPADTGIKVIVDLMHRWASEKKYYNRHLDWEHKGPVEQTTSSEVTVYDETSHSELERSQTCRMHHYYEDMRSLSTMVPLTPPSYAFFFHSTMSTICAAFINQRLPSRVDPSIAVASAVAQIVERQQHEDDAYRFLEGQVGRELYTLMESMIPMYFLGDRTRHSALLRYYTDSFTHHLAAIVTRSNLFTCLKMYHGKPGYRILIEKSVRKVLPAEQNRSLLPIVGIPDIEIQGPDITYVADYKTVPVCEQAEDAEALQAYERTISTKTQQQVNYYQGMVNVEPQHRYLAEIIYVADVTLFENQEIPGTCATLPHIGQGPNFKIVAGVKHARVLYTEAFDQNRFSDTVSQIKDLRSTYQDSTVRPTDMFQAVPLVGGGLGEVTLDQCRQCRSGVHCAFNKYLRAEEA